MADHLQKLLFVSTLFFNFFSIFTNSNEGGNIDDKVTNLHKLVFFNQHYLNSTHLHEAISEFSRLMDYHRPDREAMPDHEWFLRFYPRIAIAHTLALVVNASLTTGIELYGRRIHPEITVIDSSAWFHMRDYRNQSYVMTNRVPAGFQLVQVPNLGWSYIYCSITKKEDVSIWDFALLTDPFDLWTWLILTIAFIFVVPLSGKPFREIMPVVSAAFSIGTKEPLNKSKIFLLWLGTCMLLGNLYSGELTSKIMVPPEDEVMTTFKELKEHDYTSMHPNNMPQMLKNYQEYFNNSRVTSTGKIVQWLLLQKETVIVPPENLSEILAYDNRRLAVIGPWTNINMLAWVTKLAMSSLANKYPHSPRKKCHVSKELMTQIGQKFFIFLPPQNSEMVRAFQKLIQAGIYQRWDEEENAVMHSNRAQDRVRVKSPTNVLEMEGTLIQSQGLHGKMITMFVLWSVCHFISLIGFSLECLQFKLKRH